MFERAPFKQCQKCGEPEGLGVLGVAENIIRHRCRSCQYTTEYPLPDLEKRVIYLDQMAFSELFKLEAGTRNPAAAHHEFWVSVHRLVGRTLLLQQAIFPSSDVHQDETIVARDAAGLRAAYERLGGDARFKDTQDIESRQVWDCFEAYLEAREPTFDLSVDKVMQTKRNEWLPDMRVVVNTDYTFLADLIRDDVNRTAVEMDGLLESWRKFRPSFDDVLQYELSQFAEVRREGLARYFSEYQRALASNDPLIFMNVLGNRFLREFSNLHKEFMNIGFNDDEAIVQVCQFWNWEGNISQPAHNLSAYLFAALSRKVVAGQRRVTRGFCNDVRAISTYAPYLDAMFLDNECAALLREAPLPEALGLRAKIFSLNTRDDFLAYLEETEAGAGAEIRECAQVIYGIT